MDDCFTTGDGCRIAYQVEGPVGGPWLVLSNSLGTDRGMWSPQMDIWRQRFRVLRYDQRGHGQSDAPPGAYSLDRLGRDVVELTGSLGIELFDFCGLSLGGMVGQWLAIHTPTLLRRLVLANTSSFMGPPAAWDKRIGSVLSDGLVPVTEASIARWFTAGFPERSPAVVASIAATLRSTPRAGYAGCCAAIRDMDMRRTATLIETPVLVIGGRQDPATPAAHSHALAEAAHSARLVMLDAAHLSNVERPQEFTHAVSAFLA